MNAPTVEQQFRAAADYEAAIDVAVFARVVADAVRQDTQEIRPLELACLREWAEASRAFTARLTPWRRAQLRAAVRKEVES